MLGVVTEVTFSIEEAYLLREVLTRHTLDECLNQFEAIMRGGDHVKMWVELFSQTCGVFTANRTSETAPRDNPNWTTKNIEVLCKQQQVNNPHVYSGTSDKGPSEIGTTSLQRTLAMQHSTLVYYFPPR